MQNFPEKLNSFTLSVGGDADTNYGLKQLDKLKEPFRPFVTAVDVKTQVFSLQPSDYETQLATLTPAPTSTPTPTLNPTPFNILLPLGHALLSNVPLFNTKVVASALSISIPLQQMSQPDDFIGGKKQRRLLSSPAQQNKRPKKSKTIKNRSSATNPSHKTTKKNKHYTNNKNNNNNNNNKTKKNKLLKPILTKANQKRNKKHKRTIRRG
jgi:hypothetical protein